MKILIATAILSASFSTIASTPITVLPSGDISGLIDQQNIQAAVDTALIDNVDIKLGKGTFYVQGGVSIENYSGKISGNAQNKTKIVAVGEGDPLKRNSVFLFSNSYFSLSKISIEVPDDSSYLDSSPLLSISDGGAAIDILGGEAIIQDVNIVTSGPFSAFGEESLETGILISGCDGSVSIKNSEFTGVKRTIIFNPVLPSNCVVKVLNNQFTQNRGSVFALPGAPESINNTVLIEGNSFNDTLVGEMFFGRGVQYSIDVNSNRMENEVLGGNPGIFVDGISGELTITNNRLLTDYRSAAIAVLNATGGSIISSNTISGESVSSNGSIAIVQSDNVIITKNNFKSNTGIPGFVLPSLESVGAYEIVASTNVTINKEKHNKTNLATCQILNVPFKDTTNDFSDDLIQCAVTE